MSEKVEQRDATDRWRTLRSGDAVRTRLIAALAVFVLLISAGCSAGQPQAAGPTEGIQVHGDWTIDVVNADGTLDRHIEFGNALTSDGASQLAGYLAGVSTPGQWFIDLDGSSSNGPCATANPTFGTCEVVATASADGSGVLTLNGSVTAQNDGEIADVATRTAFCSPSVSPNDCTSTASVGAPFTVRTLAAAESVTAGQAIQVEVVLSFTSG